MKRAALVVLIFLPLTAFAQAAVQEVSLVIEPEATAPVLYKGKPLVPQSGMARVVAVADLRPSSGIPLDPATFTYTWTLDDTLLSAASGVGKSSLEIATPLPYRSRTVSVDVTSRDGSLESQNTLMLTSENPTLRIYQNDPLAGILFDHALSSTFTMTDPETSFVAAPYSFATIAAPVIQWFVNGSASQSGDSLTLRPQGSGQGSASVSVTASEGGTQNATAGLSLTFGATGGGGLFGL